MRSSQVRRANDRPPFLPCDDVLRWLKAGIEAPLPLPAFLRQFEIERLPPRVEYPVNEDPVLHDLRGQRDAVRRMAPVRLIQSNAVPRLAGFAEKVDQRFRAWLLGHIARETALDQKPD